MTYLRAKHPHLAKMVDDGMSVREAFSRVAGERRSWHRGGWSHPDVEATSMPYQDLTRAASSSPTKGGSASRIVGTGLIGAQRGWNPYDPIGLDPQTILDQQQPGGAFYGPVGVIGQTLFTPMIAAGDAIMRGGNALLHGGAAAAGQTAQEFGQSQGMGRRLERDILMLPEALSGSVGQLPSALGLGSPASSQIRNSVEHVGRIAMREIKHPGWRGFVKAPDGSFDFGYLDMDDGLGALSIRIRRGHNDKNTNSGTGLKHVEERHGAQIRKIVDENGSPMFKSVPDYVAYVARNWNEIRDNGAGRPVLVVRNPALTASGSRQQSMILELSKPRGGSFYDLKTAGPMNNRYLRNLKLLKER